MQGHHEITTENNFRFTDGEALILSLVIDIAKRFCDEDSYELERLNSIEHALAEGEHGDVALSVFGSLPLPQGWSSELKKEVFNILEMWDSLELAYELLPTERRQSVKDRLGEFSDLYTEFRGYDHHIPDGEEGYLYYTQYVLRRNRYERFQNRKIDGLVGSNLRRYQEMLQKFEAYKSTARAASRVDYGVFDWRALHGRSCSDVQYQDYEDILVDMFATDRQ